ncbi:MAG: DUF3299 domain-containing protein [Parvibaculales bacterium]
MKKKQGRFTALTMQKKYQNKFFLWFLFLLPFLFLERADAFTFEEMSQAHSKASRNYWEPIEVKGDAIPWDVFSKTMVTEDCKKNEEGFDHCIITAEYSDDVKNLDGKEVTLMGYMFPLEQSEKQKNFLIGPYPLSCPFHYYVGPVQLIEIFAKEPIKFSYDPITLKGTLALRSDGESGIFYYLENAE